jgi:replicative DNA helicase
MRTTKKNTNEAVPSAGLSEKALIKLVINNPELYDMAGLTPADFMGGEERLAWDAIGKIRKNGKISLNYSVFGDILAKMGNNNPLLFISEVKTTSVSETDFDAHLASIRSSSFGRALMDIKPELDAIANSGLEPDEMASVVFDLVSKQQSKVAQSNTNQSDFASFKQAMAERRKSPGESKRLPSYYADMDVAFNGGLPLGYHVVAALPSVGKTTFTLQMALQQALRGHKILFVSMEMLPEQLFQQALAIILGMSRAKIETQALYGGELQAYDRAEAILEKLMETNIVFDFKERQTPASIETSLLKARRHLGGLDAMYVDYLQYVDAPKEGKYNAEHEKYVEISKSLRDMYKRYRICVVALSQLNRTVEMGEIPSFNALAGSSQIERDAGIVAMLYVKQDRKQFGAGNKEIIGVEVIKGRTEGRHSLEFTFKPSMTRFETRFDFINVSKPDYVVLDRENIERGTPLRVEDKSVQKALDKPAIYAVPSDSDDGDMPDFLGDDDPFFR